VSRQLANPFYVNSPPEVIRLVVMNEIGAAVQYDGPA